MSRADVERAMVARRVKDGIECPMTLKFDAADALVVRAVFARDGIEVEWTVSRDVLRSGLERHSGSGDVIVWPVRNGRTILIQLSSPDGLAVLQLPARKIAQFLSKTEVLVPYGSETVDIDAALAQIFGVSQ